jgi:hypothetical protein
LAPFGSRKWAGLPANLVGRAGLEEQGRRRDLLKRHCLRYDESHKNETHENEISDFDQTDRETLVPSDQQS